MLYEVELVSDDDGNVEVAIKQVDHADPLTDRVAIWIDVEGDPDDVIRDLKADLMTFAEGGNEPDDEITDDDTDWTHCLCNDCEMDTTPHPTEGPHEWYTVRDRVWNAVMGPGYLCIGCLEKRLGRRLTPNDFTDAPVNGPPWSFGATNRLNSRRWPQAQEYIFDE